MKDHLLSSLIQSFLFCTLSLPITTAAVAPLPFTETPKSLPQPLITSGIPRCAFSQLQTWTMDHVKLEDCQTAIARFKDNFDAHGTTKFEFSSHSHKPKTKLPHVFTPSCHDHGACSVCFTMLSDFSPNLLYTIPRLPPQPWETNDISDTGEIWTAAKSVGETCVSNLKTFGWASVGSYQSMGVFVWARGSVLEKDAFRSEGPENVTTPVPMGNRLGLGLGGTATS